MKLQSALQTIVVAILFSLMLHCNLFSPTDSSRRPEGDRYRGYALLLEGKIKMSEGLYHEALDYFDRALETNDSLSEAYFYRGKCILRLQKIDLEQVWTEINPDRIDARSVPFLYQAPPGRSLSDSIVPFFLSQSPGDTARILIDSVFLERKRIYDAVCVAIKNLDTIHYQAHRMDGVMQRSMYESDYLVEISIKTALGIIDINHNDTLDFRSLEPRTYQVVCQDIPDLDSMELDSLRSISRNPGDINTQLDLLIATVGRADTSYLNFSRELKSGAQKSQNLDTNMAAGVGELIGGLKDILPFFFYNDFIDNDGTWFNSCTVGEGRLTSAEYGRFNIRRVIRGFDTVYARMDRMIWIDWDNDKLIDVDSAGTMHIGDPAHMQRFPQYYTLIDPPGARYKRYLYKGGYTFEFIGGDFGVDEEIMDGEDNDLDGLTDEDTRIVADTLDDDGDYFHTNPYRTDTLFAPMIWNGIVDPFISITLLGWDSVRVSAPFVAAHGDHFSIGAAIRLPRYKGSWAGDFTAGDYGLDEEWYDGLDNDGDGLVDEDVGERKPPVTLRNLIIDSLRARGLRQ